MLHSQMIPILKQMSPILCIGASLIKIYSNIAFPSMPRPSLIFPEPDCKVCFIRLDSIASSFSFVTTISLCLRKMSEIKPSILLLMVAVSDLSNSVYYLY